MKGIVCALLAAILSVPAVCETWIEVGAMWHDGEFSPFACFVNQVSAVGLMRNGTGYGDDHSIYLIWVEVREENWAFMLGARINLIVDDIEIWQLWGWWAGWKMDEQFARGGQIFSWHGEGWAIWPLVELGFSIR